MRGLRVQIVGAPLLSESLSHHRKDTSSLSALATHSYKPNPLQLIKFQGLFCPTFPNVAVNLRPKWNSNKKREKIRMNSPEPVKKCVCVFVEALTDPFGLVHL